MDGTMPSAIRGERQHGGVSQQSAGPNATLRKPGSVRGGNP
jgi:hypothetical protein